MFVNWENIDLNYEEHQQDSDPSRTKQNANTIHEENEQIRLAQLRKLQGQKDINEHSRDFITKMTNFGELLIKNSTEEISNTLLTEDCETFLFNFAEVAPAQYEWRQEGFAKIFKKYRIIQREVKESYADPEKATGFQFCYCLIRNEKDSSTISQFSFEVFSFRNEKISKYRASFGGMPQLSDAKSLFTPSRKERMLTKVKELNYAFTDQPDLERVASLLHENTEYKIWRWQDKKCSTFNKENFSSEFKKSLEEEFVIKCIVPFDPSIEAQYVVGSYVYYLEGKRELSGQKYHWISTCIYSFDRDANLTKISQQGELYGEDEILIPFEVHSKEYIKERIDAIYAIGPDTDLSIFSHEDVNFSFDLGIFGESRSPLNGLIKGLSEYKRLAEVLAGPEGDFGTTGPIDIYLGCDDPCYDTAITLDYAQEIFHKEGDPNDGKFMSVFGMRKFCFENGKLAKVIVFVYYIPEPIPSPYDDDNFIKLNIRPKHEFFQ